MAIPTVLPRWAVNDEIDSLTGAENKVQPTEEFKLSGVKRGEFIPRAYLNYQFDLISDWIAFLGNQNTVFDLTGATEIDYANGGIQTLTLSANTTLTEVMNSGETVYLVITAGGFTLTYPASFDFGDAGTPTLLTTNIIKATKIGSVVYASQEWSKT